MWGFLSGLLGLADPISKITQAITDEKVKLAAAANDKERIASQERVSALEARRSVLMAEASGSPLNSFIRAGFALPFVVYNAKLVLWDKVLAVFTNGTTDPLSPELVQIELACIGFYFLYDIAARLKR